MKYFELTDDMTVPGRWALGTPTDTHGRELDDPWAFTDGRPMPDPGRLKVPVAAAGRAIDFTRAGLLVPVVHVQVANVLEQHARDDVQLFPVEVQGQPEQFCILVATRLVRCIDDTASKAVERWTPDDGQPEKIGEYRNVRGLRIDPTRVGDARVFRTWGWSVALIVREDLKNELERIHTSGVKFKEV